MLLPAMVPLVEAVNRLLIGWKSLRIPRWIEGVIIVCVDESAEGIILGTIERIVGAYALRIIPCKVLILLSWIHNARLDRLKTTDTDQP